MSSLRIISRKRLKAFWIRHPKAKTPLERWYAVAEAIHWKHFGDVRRTFRSADQTRVASGNTVAIFDIGGNNYRIVAAIHYDKARVFVLRVMTHPEYDKNWKEDL